MENIIVVIIGVSLVLGVSYFFSKGKAAKKSFNSEAEYKEFCDQNSYIYIPNYLIRYVTFGKDYPLEKVGSLRPNIYINIGMLEKVGVIESIEELSKMKNFETITFMQGYGTKDVTFSWLAYPSITKEILKERNFQSDQEFFNWLYSTEPKVVDSRNKELDVNTITDISVGVDNFGLEIFKTLPVDNISEIVLGQGKVSMRNLEGIMNKYTNAKRLRLDFIELVDTTDVNEDLIRLCNTYNLDFVRVNLYNNIDVTYISSKLTAGTDFQDANNEK